MTIFPILNGPSTPGLQQGEGALHQPVIVLISAEGGYIDIYLGKPYPR